MRVLRWSLLAAALAFIAVATLTPGSTGFTGPLRPDFWCLACGATGGADVIVNVLLFVPFGAALALFGVSVPRVFATGFMLSVAIELAQRAGFPPSRVFNATDIMTNTAGALIGGILMHTYRSWILPSRRAARRLVIASAACTAALLLVVAWALGPNADSADSSPAGLSRSSYTHGYGWYHGFISRVTLGDTSVERSQGFTISHTGDGPVILEGASHVRAVRVELSGRDERESFVPFVLLNDARDNAPDLLLGQQAADARLSVRLRGSRLRLPAPRLVLRDVFPPDVAAGNADANTAGSVATTANNAAAPSAVGADGSARDERTQKIVVAKVSPAEWVLTARSGVSSRAAETGTDARSLPSGTSARLVISLGVGWTLLQGVVAHDHWLAPVVTIAWMFVLWVPLGYWCTFWGTREPMAAAFVPASKSGSAYELRPHLVSLSVLVLTLASAPRWAGIADSPWSEWGTAVAGYATGVFFAMRVQRNRKWFEARWSRATTP